MILSSSRATVARALRPQLARAASTQPPRGMREILSKNPDDVVFTFAKRTAVGKARKGQFKDVPVDEMLLALFKVRLCDQHRCSLADARFCIGHAQEDRTRSSEDRRHLRRDMSPSVAAIRLSGGRPSRWHPQLSPHLYRQPSVFLWTHGGPQHRARDSCRRNWHRHCRRR